MGSETKSSRGIPESAFRALFEAAPACCLVLAPDAPRFSIVAVNEAYLRATGARREDVVGRGIFDASRGDPTGSGADGASELRASLERVLEHRRPDAMAVVKVDAPRPALAPGRQATYWSALNSPVLGEGGAVEFILHRVEDVSGSVRLGCQGAGATKPKDGHEGTPRDDRLERRTRFLADLSHELRTPLALVLGPIEKLLRAAGLPPAERQELERAGGHARLLLKRVNDLLDASKLDAGQVRLACADVDLAQAVRLAASHFESVAHEKGIEYAVDAPPTLRAEVDADKIERVLVNLLSNAFKFTPQGGRVRCTLAPGAEGVAVLEVADSGPGIPPELRGAAFERFRQLEVGSTRRFGGTGLGLAIARDLVRLHRGEIAIGDAPEGGALLRVELPTAAAAEHLASKRAAAPFGEQARAAADEVRFAQAPAGAPAERHAGGRPLVLVAEDDAELNRLIRESLAPAYQTVGARDGEEALEKALALVPDAILTDVMMPAVRGDELVRCLRRHPALEPIPIVILTARADDELKLRLLREGAQDYLTKPFSLEELHVRIGNAVAVARTRAVLQRDLASQAQDLESLARALGERHRRADLLARASEILGGALGTRSALERLANLAARELADLCSIDLVADDLRIECAAIAAADDAQAARARELRRRHLLDWDSSEPPARALRTCLPVREEIAASALEALQRPGARADWLRELGMRWVLSVPLVSAGQAIGAITLATSGERRRLDAEDVALASELAHRTALAVENARLYQQAKEAVRVRDEFLSIASHELKTPLTALQLQVHMLARRAGEIVQGPSVAWLRERLESVARQGSRLGRLINELLEVSRIAGDRLVPDLQRVDLSEVVREVERRFLEGGEVDRSGCKLTLELEDGLVGRWDRMRLEEVVTQLLDNALKFGAGKPITISTRRDGADALLRVEDQGIGISLEHQQRIFQMFERAVSIRHYGGLGLGLHVVQQIVRALGGMVEVASTPGTGAAFRVKLPLAGPPDPRRQPSAPPIAPEA